jgi:hypothetical protein
MMLLFALVTWLALIVLFLLLTRHTYRHLPLQSEEQTGSQGTRGESTYLTWMLGQALSWFQHAPVKRSVSTYHKLCSEPYSNPEKWIHIGLSLSFLYLAASGFVFSALLLRSLTGMFLVLHMILGGIFSVNLALFVFLRAKDYPLDEHLPDPSGRHQETICFWIFILSGFLLVLTALLMMVPLWALIGHLKIVWVHRFAALSGLLSATAFVYFKWYRARDVI